ncbi:hypothetical protein AU467_17585 [Mesorhizobium loti]|uniref:Uncharacterized protein n=1 Tax=Rhizobium loti TaxID=381 RepID=A0A117N453_RHILI|nr:hypothetical protein AU467_17585 [Mesorhizobium loti]
MRGLLSLPRQGQRRHPQAQGGGRPRLSVERDDRRPVRAARLLVNHRTVDDDVQAIVSEVIAAAEELNA